MRFLRSILGRSGARAAVETIDLPSMPREEIAPFLVTDEGMPQVDWGMADAWIENQVGDDAKAADSLRRAVAASWLDELRDALTTDSRRWRHASVEGLAPLEGTIGPRVARAADKSIRMIGRALKELRGDARTNPIRPIAVVVLGTADEYYSFISHHYSEEGEYATSGGIYLGDESGHAFPLLVVNGQVQHDLEPTIAHELTHHALAVDRHLRATCKGLPTWAEEGLTQIMEAHVAEVSHFAFGRDMIERHRAWWKDMSLEEFATGDSFHSPEGEAQELSYSLAEALVRSLSSTNKKAFIAFVRACREQRVDHAEAEREHFGATVQELAERLIWQS